MPLYKAWDVKRQKRKAVVASGYEEFAKGGKLFYGCFDLRLVQSMIVSVKRA